MNEAGITVEGSKGEWGKGQHEINLEYSDPVEMADRHVIFKEGVKAIATRHGVSATFMAKVHHDMAGSSCHLHLSLLDKNGKNCFWDSASGKPSAFFRSFLAGCMAHAQETTLFLAPTVNSYKRYRAATFAPVCVAWGVDNRTCGFRVVGHGRSLRIENRIPGADVNPYLAFAAMIASGLDGVDNKMELCPPTTGNAYLLSDVPRVPNSLAGAISALSKSSFARKALGDDVIDHYLKLAELELANFESKVTDWETARYFERV
jgi:glutamine synthetase